MNEVTFAHFYSTVFSGCVVIILNSVCPGMWYVFLIIHIRMMKEFHITGVNSKQICDFRKESSNLKMNEHLQKPNVGSALLSDVYGEGPSCSGLG